MINLNDVSSLFPPRFRFCGSHLLKHFEQPAVKPWSFEGPKDSTGAVALYLSQRRMGSTSAHGSYMSGVRRGPDMSRQWCRDLHLLQFESAGFDKVFASAWISNDEIVVGTKCQKLLRVNVRTGEQRPIAVYNRDLVSGMQRQSDRSGVAVQSNENVPYEREYSLPVSTLDEAPDGYCSPRGALYAPDQISEAQAVPQPRESMESPTIVSPSVQEFQDAATGSGMHAIAVNPSKTLMATSGAHCADVVLYSLPSCRPIAVLRGHKDKVFSVQFVSESRLYSGGRDGNIRSWDVSVYFKGEPDFTPGDSDQDSAEDDKWMKTHVDDKNFCTHHLPVVHSCMDRISRDSVRDMQRQHDGHHSASTTIMTMDREGHVSRWDAGHLAQISFDIIRDSYDTVASAVMPGSTGCLTAIGSRKELFFLDFRQSKSPVVHSSSLGQHEMSDGVRSMAWNNEMLAVGGGCGGISFYDIRNQQFAPLSLANAQPLATHCPGVVPGLAYATEGMVEPLTQDISIDFGAGGWIYASDSLLENFSRTKIRNAVYSLEFDDSGRHLFAAGGPLQQKLVGSVMGVFS